MVVENRASVQPYVGLLLSLCLSVCLAVCLSPFLLFIDIDFVVCVLCCVVHLQVVSCIRMPYCMAQLPFISPDKGGIG